MVLKSVFIEQRVAAHEAVLEESHDVIAILEACDIDVKTVCASGEHLREFQAPIHRVDFHACRFCKREVRFDLESL